MNKYLDYEAYRKENKSFSDLIENNSFMCYNRISDIIFVLDKIAEKAKDEELIDDEVENIFDIGFDQLYTELEFLKSLYKNELNNDLFLFKKYDQAIHYSLLLSEILSDLENQKGFTKKAKTILSTRAKELIDYACNKKEIPNNYFDDLDIEVDSLLPKDYQFATISSIFEDIAMEVALWN